MAKKKKKAEEKKKPRKPKKEKEYLWSILYIKKWKGKLIQIAENHIKKCEDRLKYWQKKFMYPPLIDDINSLVYELENAKFQIKIIRYTVLLPTVREYYLNMLRYLNKFGQRTIKGVTYLGKLEISELRGKREIRELKRWKKDVPELSKLLSDYLGKTPTELASEVIYSPVDEEISFKFDKRINLSKKTSLLNAYMINYIDGFLDKLKRMKIAARKKARELEEEYRKKYKYREMLERVYLPIGREKIKVIDKKEIRRLKRTPSIDLDRELLLISSMEKSTYCTPKFRKKIEEIIGKHLELDKELDGYLTKKQLSEISLIEKKEFGKKIKG